MDPHTPPGWRAYFFLSKTAIFYDVWALELSAERVRKLRTQLQQRGASSLVDQRTGQAQEYRMAPATKAELIWQYIVNLEGGRAVAAARLKQDLEQRGASCPSAQTIRLHVKKLGLDHLRKKKQRAKG